MAEYRIGRSSRILPGGMDNEIHRLPMRIAGAALIAMAVIGWVSLLTWSIGDPSVNRATGGAPSNLLGTTGASLADMLLQFLGLTSIALFLPPAIWGVTLISGDRVSHPRHRLAMWTLSLMLIASTLSILPQPKSWLLTHGLGGLIGDFGRSFFMGLAGVVNQKLAAVIGGTVSGLLGVWTLLRASGLSGSELRLLWRWTSRRHVGRQGWFGAGLAYAFRGAWLAGERVAGAARRRRPSSYWQAEDPDRFVTRPRPAPGGFDARYGGFDLDDGTPFVAPKPRRREPQIPPRQAVPAAAQRIEPYFDSLRTIPRQRAQAPAIAPAQPQYIPQHRGASPVQLQHAQPYAPPVDSADWDEPDDAELYEPQPIAYVGPTARHAEPAYEAPHEDEAAYEAPILSAPVFRPQRPGQRAQSVAARPRSVVEHRSRLDEIDAGAFVLPPLSLLSPPPARHNDPELSDAALGRRAELLQGVLEDFRVKGQIAGVHPGPVITLYEFEPARGTKSSRVIGLADDIARSMSAVSARVAVIPGRDAIGIELPNQNREVVYLRELLESKEFTAGKGRLLLALGKTIGGDPVIVDLARMPHLLIAGTTGSGKSVAINTMILSLLYRLPPEECRFIMIDPKMLELSVYDGIPHLLTPVVTDPQKAIMALKWTVNEMNARYERMCKLGVRNILGFNAKVTRARRTGEPLARTVQTGFDEETGSAIYEREDVDGSPMPYIVVVIDEMADLMMVAGKEIEFAVQRLSQMARAAGIHLIMATQRPSVDVITGTIKANFPSRISFQVTSKIDSRTILGEMGAEQLLGSGDMLTMAGGGRIMRAHGPFVADDEVESVVNVLREQGEPDYMEGLLDEDYGGEDGGDDAGARGASGDEVYDQAIAVVMRDRRATTSYLQRRLGIGYNRAASLIERMEADGLISAPNRTGKREVLAGDGG